MDKKRIDVLQEENKVYENQIYAIENDIADKKIINRMSLIIIFSFSLAIILGGVSIFSKYFQNIIPILIQEIFDVLPISALVYLGARLATSFIYGFNNSNLKKIKTMKRKIKRNNNELEKIVHINNEKTKVNEETRTYTLEDYSYQDSLSNTSKVKKIGAIKR